MTSRDKELGVSLWIPSAIPFFLFGFVYYLVTPYFTLLLFSDELLVEAALRYISIDYFDVYYFLDLFVILVFYIGGYMIGQCCIKRDYIFIDRLSLYKVSPLIIASLLIIVLGMVFLKIRSTGVALFSGYETYDVSVLGPIATLVFTVSLFYNFFVNSLVKKIYLALFFISSIVLLGFGSRMFFLLGLITIMLGVVSKKSYLLRSLRFYVFLGLTFLFVVGVGLWRSGGGGHGSSPMLSIFLIEPLFTATSGSLYIENSGGRPLVNYPNDLLASFVNFVPSFAFPDKMNFINLIIYDSNKYSPFGANALISNLYSNFGVFYPFYVFIIGLIYGFLCAKSHVSSFFRAVYFSLLPVLMFHFYREGFITFIKVFLFNGIFLPFLVLMCLYVFLRRK